ncbi:hypothetical protein GH868_30060, partial [Bacillus thuringiensis]|nr:hypothetical protein [Bacillus thuringiensis]
CEATFFAAVDCKKCNKTSNYIGYVADKCDCSHYYQCELVNGEWLATHMPCPPCQHWDPAKLTCVVSKDTTPCEVVTMAAVTEGRWNVRAGDKDDSGYIAQAP